MIRFFEHPLTAATSAMLNISGANNSTNNDDESGATTASVTAATTSVSIGALGTPHQVHQVHNPNGSTSFVYEYYKVPDKDNNIQWAWVYFFSLLFSLCRWSPFSYNKKIVFIKFSHLIRCHIRSMLYAAEKRFFNRILTIRFYNIPII